MAVVTFVEVFVEDETVASRLTAFSAASPTIDINSVVWGHMDIF